MARGLLRRTGRQRDDLRRSVQPGARAAARRSPNGRSGFSANPDGQPVQTATGFGNKYSSHCAFARLRDSIKYGYEEMASHMDATGLTARLQLGEVLWWYFADASGMAFYDAYATDRFQTAHGCALHTFLTPN